MRTINLNTFSTGFVFIGIAVLAFAVIALVIWVAVLSSRLKRVTDALMAHSEPEHTTIKESHESMTVRETPEEIVAAAPPATDIGATSGGAFSEANSIDLNEAMLAEQHAAESQALAMMEAQAQAAIGARNNAEAGATAQYVAAQQLTAAQAAQRAAAYPQTEREYQPSGNYSPYNPAQQQAAHAVHAQQVLQQQSQMLTAQQRAALARQQNAMQYSAQSQSANRTLPQNDSAFFDQRQARDEDYSFDGGTSQFFDDYRDETGRHEKSFGRKTPTIPFGTERDVVEKRESYAEAAISGEFDLDSIDFSKVAGYRRPTR